MNTIVTPPVLSWGECARKCLAHSKQVLVLANRCKFWTWESTYCTNCKPERCIIHGGQAVEVANKHYGHIAGEVECQDIRYTETDEAKIYDGLTQEAESVPGRCLVPKKGLVDVGERPHCAEQEVPGYRFDLLMKDLPLHACMAFALLLQRN